MFENYFNLPESDYHEFHNEPEQLKRQKSATYEKLTPISVDHANQSCSIKGSGKEPYNVTLETCTCADFIRRKLPCKHMYRLAFELGLLTLPGEVKSTNIIQYRTSDDAIEFVDITTGEISKHRTVEEFLSMLETLSVVEQKILRYYARTLGYGSKYCNILNPSITEKLVELEYISYKQLYVSDVLEEFKKYDLISKIESLNVAKKLPYKKNSKAVLKEFLRNNYNEEITTEKVRIAIVPSPYTGNYLTIYKRLNKILGNSVVTNISLSEYLRDFS